MIPSFTQEILDSFFSSFSFPLSEFFDPTPKHAWISWSSMCFHPQLLPYPAHQQWQKCTRVLRGILVRAFFISVYIGWWAGTYLNLFKRGRHASKHHWLLWNSILYLCCLYWIPIMVILKSGLVLRNRHRSVGSHAHAILGGEAVTTDVGKRRTPGKGLQSHHHFMIHPCFVWGAFYELVTLLNFFNILSVSYIWFQRFVSK